LNDHEQFPRHNNAGLSFSQKIIYALRDNKRRKQSCAYEENQALKILKRPFGYFCGSGQKLHAQQGGISSQSQSYSEVTKSVFKKGIRIAIYVK
jgi:hypothetical protein